MGIRVEGLARVARRWALPALVFCLIVACGSIIAVLLPPGAGPDEPMHVARVEQIAEGGLLPVPVDDGDLDISLVGPSSDRYDLYGGKTDAALYELVVTGNLSFYSDRDAPYAFPTWDDPRLASGGEMGEGAVSWLFPNTAINSPLSYAPHVLAYDAASALTTNPWAVVVCMRLAGVLAYAAAALLCLLLLPVGRGVFALVAVLPQSLATCAVVSADPMAFAYVSVFVSCVVRMLWNEEVGPRTWVLLALSTAALCLAKVTYAPFGLLLLLLPVAHASYRAPRRLLAVGAVGFGSIALFVAWYLLVRDVNTGVMWSAAIDPEAQAALVSADPARFLGPMATTLLRTDLLVLTGATPYTGGEISASWLSVVALLLVALPEAVELSRRPVSRRVALLLAGGLALVWAIVAVLICLALYLQFNAVGASDWVDGVQARYFAPLAFPLLLAVMLALRCLPGAASVGAGEAGAPEALGSGALAVRAGALSVVVLVTAATFLTALFG